MTRVMRLTAAFIIVCCLHVSAKTWSQSITFSGEKVPLEKIFQEIRKQTNYYVAYEPSMLENASPVTVRSQNLPLEAFLQQVLKDQPLTYFVKKTTIFIRQKEEAPKKETMSPPVTGIVRSVDGAPLGGVNVVVKGTKRGTVTKEDGSFSIEANEGEILVISNIGFAERVITVGGNETVGIIELVKSESKLDEVQIIAYGETTKRLNTGNVSTIKAADIQKSPVSNPILGIAGRIPGIQITQASGFANSGVSILIQGQNSLLNGSDPFYVIDGVPFTSQLLPNLANILRTSGRGNGFPTNGNPLSFINPLDIASIDILKDADATAIYGSRAANGAILITTKKGQAGEMRIDLNVQSGFGRVARKLNTLSTSDYIAMRTEAYKNDGIDFHDPMQAYAPDLTLWSPSDFTDWQKTLIGNRANYSDAKLTVSGGSKNVQYLIGSGFHRESTVFPSDLTDKKVSMNFNISSTSSNEKFRINLTGSYLADNNKLIAVDLTEKAVLLSPNAPRAKNIDGTLNWAPDITGNSTWGFDQPLAFLNNKYRNKSSNLIGASNLSYKLTEGFYFRTSFGYNNMLSDEIQVNVPSSIPPELRSNYPRKTQYGSNSIVTYIIEPQLSFERTLGFGKISALAGSTFQNTRRNRQLVEGKGYASDDVMENINAATSVTVPPNSSIASQYKYAAVFGRLTYNTKNKYIVNITARRDGSSRFGSANQYHNFGAIGAAWIFSNERFAKTLQGLSFGKFRISYGTTGNDQIGDYRFMSLYENYNTPVAYRGGPSLVSNNLTNPLLKWEETRKLQMGIDLGFIDDKLYLSGNYYRNRSSNQLLAIGLPATVGPTVITANLPAVVENSGLELSFTSINMKQRDFEWSTSLNITVPKNKLLRFNDEATKKAYEDIYVEGKSINIVRAYKFSGVNPATGIYQFTDKEGKLTSDPGFGIENKIVLINPDQPYYGGIQNSLSYKSFSFDVLFHIVKQKGTNNRFTNGSTPGAGPNVNQPVEVLKRWQKSGDDLPYQKFTTNDFSAIFANIYGMLSDEAWQDASYVRLKNVSIAWSMPKRWTDQVKVKSVRLYLQGQNVFTITNYKGLDPETLSSLSLPPLRTLTFGAQITL